MASEDFLRMPSGCESRNSVAGEMYRLARRASHRYLPPSPPGTQFTPCAQCVLCFYANSHSVCRVIYYCVSAFWTPSEKLATIFSTVYCVELLLQPHFRRLSRSSDRRTCTTAPTYAARELSEMMPLMPGSRYPISGPWCGLFVVTRGVSSAKQSRIARPTTPGMRNTSESIKYGTRSAPYLGPI